LIAVANAVILATRAQLAQPSAMIERPKHQRKAKERRRLAAALRENLRRRKLQERARDQGRTVVEPAVDRPDPAHDSAGIGKDNR